MHYQVTQQTNFCRVFELPAEFPEGYCFQGGHPIVFLMVDWFHPVQMGSSILKEVDMDELAESLLPFIKEKNYVKPGKNYLLVCDFGGTIYLREEEQ